MKPHAVVMTSKEATALIGGGYLEAGPLVTRLVSSSDREVAAAVAEPEWSILIDRRTYGSGRLHCRVNATGELALLAWATGERHGALAFPSRELLLRLVNLTSLRVDGSNAVQSVRRVELPPGPAGGDLLADPLNGARRTAAERVTLFVEPDRTASDGLATCLAWVRTSGHTVLMIPAIAADDLSGRVCAEVPESFLWLQITRSIRDSGWRLWDQMLVPDGAPLPSQI